MWKRNSLLIMEAPALLMVCGRERGREKQQPLTSSAGYSTVRDPMYDLQMMVWIFMMNQIGVVFFWSIHKYPIADSS